ncbi:MAG: Ca2+/Na+ antiporter [Planctomycetota bacterium]|jgi:Ca2+/Na+ antiporter
MKHGEARIVLPGMQSALSGWTLITAAGSASILGVGFVAAVQSARGAMPAMIGLAFSIVCIVLGVIGLFMTLPRWTRRLSVSQLLVHLQNERPLLLYRTFFGASLAMLTAGLVLLQWSNFGMGFVQAGAMFAAALAGLELSRRHARQRARIVFTLYVDDLLDALTTTSIDAERQQNAKFDAAVRGFQQWNAVVLELSRV